MNIERGDTFIVNEEYLQGNHFTCVRDTGVSDGVLLAGDTQGRMWKFVQRPNHKMRVYKDTGETWKRYRMINAESIIEE